jgi:hypothetical protein
LGRALHQEFQAVYRKPCAMQVAQNYIPKFLRNPSAKEIRGDTETRDAGIDAVKLNRLNPRFEVILSNRRLQFITHIHPLVVRHHAPTLIFNFAT